MDQGIVLLPQPNQDLCGLLENGGDGADLAFFLTNILLVDADGIDPERPLGIWPSHIAQSARQVGRDV